MQTTKQKAVQYMTAHSMESRLSVEEQIFNWSCGKAFDYRKHYGYTAHRKYLFVASDQAYMPSQIQQFMTFYRCLVVWIDSHLAADLLRLLQL